MLFLDYRNYNNRKIEINPRVVVYGSKLFFDNYKNTIESLSKSCIFLLHTDEINIIGAPDYIVKKFREEYPEKIFHEIHEDDVKQEYIIGKAPISRNSFFLERYQELSQITPNLYLSGQTVIENKDLHDSFGIKSIVNATQELDNVFEKDPEYTYFRATLRDVPEQQISSYFMPVIEFIDTEITKGKSVLVHCAAGVSRSASLIIAYIMKSRKLSLKEAFTYVNDRRPIIDPNIGFFKQLSDFETSLTKQIKT
jgi:protein-tyrosine phosphatase